MILISALMETAITITEATFLVLKKQVNLEQMAMCRNKKSSYKSRAITPSLVSHTSTSTIVTPKSIAS